MSAIVIGNLALDEAFLLPALPRPGETVLATETARDLGGKGANQAVLLARAGVPTRLVARIGRDEAGASLRAMLGCEGMQRAGLIETDAPTDRSIVLLAADGENSIVSTAHCAGAMTVQDVSAALNATGADLLLMQGNLSAGVTEAALRIAQGRGMKTVFNPAPADPGFAALWKLADLVVLNRTEARDLTGRDAEDAAAHIRAAGAASVAVTLGADGAVLQTADRMHRAPAAAVTVRDTTGAGDTFTAILAAALFARRLPPETALRCAAQAAAITVSRRGTLKAFPTRAELAAILAE